MNHAYVRKLHGITWKIVPQPRLNWLLCCDLHETVSLAVISTDSREKALDYVAQQRTGVGWWDRIGAAHLPADLRDLNSWRRVPYPDGLAL